MTILVVCEQTMFRDGLGLLLQSRLPQPDVQFADSCQRALALRRPNRAPVVVLVDVGLPDIGGRSSVEVLREAFSPAPVIGLADDRRQPEVERSLRVGARMCVLKSASADILLAALQLAESSAICLPTPTVPVPIEEALHSDIRPVRAPGQASPTPADLGLTPKQSRVLHLLLQGKSAKGIARELGLCTGTVKTHTTAVLRALNVNTRTQAVLAANRIGLQVDVCH